LTKLGLLRCFKVTTVGSVDRHRVGATTIART
jgi:hypothetical protein